MKKIVYFVIALLALTPQVFAQVSFTGGHVQTLTICGSLDSVNVQLTVWDTTLGRRITLSLLDSPTHGNAVVVDTLIGMDTTTVPAGLYYKANPGYTGPDTFIVVASDSVGTDTTEIIVAVHEFPYAGVIDLHRIDSSVFCFNDPQRDTATLSEAVSGGIWSVANTALASVTSAGFFTQTMFETGLDTVLYTVTDSGCTSVAMFRVILTICEGAPNLAGPHGGVLITPNPSYGGFSVTIGAADAEKVQIQIIDALGRQVYEDSTSTNTATDINLKAAAGIYILTARTAHDVWTERVLLQ